MVLKKAVTRAFKLIFKLTQSFHEKSHFYPDYKKFWIVENFRPVIDRLDQIKTKQNAKRISNFDISTCYTKLPHKGLLKVLFDLIDFGFDGSSKKKIHFFKKKAFWTNKLKTKSKSSFKRTGQFLIENSYFTVGNVILLHTVRVPMGTDPAPFWANLYSYSYESKYITNLIRTHN